MTKKNVCVGIFASMFACGYALTTQNVVEAKAYNGDIGSAEYVSIEEAPVIDGIYDDVWENAEPVITGEGGYWTVGEISVIWNETGLYLFAKVHDTTLNISDRCNFWVSETYYNVGYYNYPDLDGAYYLCLNPEGENQYYISSNVSPLKYDDMQGKYQVATQIQENVYYIELYVPLTGKNDLFLHNSIGFNVSVDDYLTEGGERDSYSYWCATGSYWENPATCGEMILVDNYLEDGKEAPVKPSMDNSASTSSDVNSSNSQENISDEISSEQSNSGCGATVSAMSWCVVLGIGAVALKKKKD